MFSCNFTTVQLCWTGPLGDNLIRWALCILWPLPLNTDVNSKPVQLRHESSALYTTVASWFLN